MCCHVAKSLLGDPVIEAIEPTGGNRDRPCLRMLGEPDGRDSFMTFVRCEIGLSDSAK